MKCEILIKMNRKNEALEDLCEVSKLNPKNSKSWFVQGRLCSELGLFDEAVHKYEMILEFEPKNKLALYGKSISLCKSQKFKEAIESFEFLASIYQDDEEIWVKYSLIALDFGIRNKENPIVCRAAYAFQKASELDQGNVELWLNAAVLCKEIGSAYGAEFCLKRAAEIDIEFVKAKVKNDIIFQPLKDLESILYQPLENLESRKAIGKDIFKRVFRRLF
jgi:tetratricopeptide (TPR) repeat protein